MRSGVFGLFSGKLGGLHAIRFPLPTILSHVELSSCQDLCRRERHGLDGTRGAPPRGGPRIQIHRRRRRHNTLQMVCSNQASPHYPLPKHLYFFQVCGILGLMARRDTLRLHHRVPTESRLLAVLLALVLMVMPLLSIAAPVSADATGHEITMPCHETPYERMEFLDGDCCDGFCAGCGFCIISAAVPAPGLVVFSLHQGVACAIQGQSGPTAGFPDYPYRPPAMTSV
jgi:hypothetical protein